MQLRDSEDCSFSSSGNSFTSCMRSSCSQGTRSSKARALSFQNLWGPLACSKYRSGIGVIQAVKCGGGDHFFSVSSNLFRSWVISTGQTAPVFALSCSMYWFLSLCQTKTSSTRGSVFKCIGPQAYSACVTTTNHQGVCYTVRTPVQQVNKVLIDPNVKERAHK